MSPTYPPSTSPVEPNAVAEMAQQARMSVPTFMCRFTDQTTSCGGSSSHELSLHTNYLKPLVNGF